MKPVAFMRIKKITKLGDALRRYSSSDLIVQVKDDGFKLFASKSASGKVSLYTRRGKEVTAKLPGIATAIDARAPAGSSFLGELVYLINRKQSIAAVGSIVQSTPARAVSQTNALGGKLEYRVYEMLEFGGEEIADLPLVERERILHGIFSNRGDVRVVKSYPWSQRNAALRDANRQNAEGLVIKPKDSAYIFNRAGEEEPTGEWFKYKPPGKANETDVILRSYRAGKSKLIFTAFQFDGDELVEVGKLSGLPRNDEKTVQGLIDGGEDVIVEVSYQERHPTTKKLRHMGWVRLRTDKPRKSARINPSRMRVKNPRTSKLKVALAAEAVDFPKFPEFAEAYWNDCARGVYWYPTDDEGFDISKKEQDLAKGGRFAVFCNPEMALSGANRDKKYIAEINVVDVVRSKFSVVRGSQGAKIKVKDLQDAYVMRVLEADRAKRSWKYQQGLLPSSKDQLRALWKKAHADKKERMARERKREERRLKRQAERDKRRDERLKSKG